MTLFDHDAVHQDRIARAREERDAALAQVAGNAGDDWNTYAWEFLIDYLIHNETLFTDDLWAIGDGPGLRQPPTTMRALGPLVQRAARRGHIVKTGQYRPRTFGHLAEGPVWKSMLYLDPADLGLDQ